MGAVLDASNWRASRPELGLAALTPRLFCFRGKKKGKNFSRTVFRVASSGQGRREEERERRRQALLLSSFVQRQRLPDLGEPRRSADSAAAVEGARDSAAVVAVAVVCHCYR